MKQSLTIICIFIQGILFACGGITQQVYSGKIEYSLDPQNPFKCTATITMDFDINEALANDSIWVAWGDQNVTIMRAINVSEDTAASANTGGIKIYTHVYSGSHIYDSLPQGGYYYISFANEYRINGVNNIASGDGVNLPFYLMAQVGIDTTANGSYLPLTFPALTIGFANFESYAQNGLQQPADGMDSIAYGFNEPLETVSNPVPEYLLPDQFCLANGSAGNSFVIDAPTGRVTWASPCLQGIYCFGTLLSKYRNGHLLSAIMREQNIYVSPDYVNGVKGTNHEANNLMVYPNPAGQTLQGTVNITNPEAEDNLEIIAPDGRVLVSNIAIQNGHFETDISQLPNGVYLLRLQYPSDVFTLKFVKQ